MSGLNDTSLAVWYLGDVDNPRLVGGIRLDGNMRRCILDLDDEWCRSGFELSPDLPLDKGTHSPLGEMLAPGAADDAIPDSWGERVIRIVSRPSRMSPLDKLWYAGDRRFGALGISSSFKTYTPCEEVPLMRVESLVEAQALIARVIEREPLDERERQLIASGGSLGGAHPKMLIEHEGEEWIAKFPRGSNIDQLLIEHASMELARRAGLNVASSMALLGDVDHVLMVRRFDRIGSRRIHAVSARTMLARESDDSYVAISALIRRHAAPGQIKAMQRELFRRMVFNIMIDNTDDHTKNHAFLRNDDGHWELSPAYDIPPQVNGLGQQAIQISSTPGRLNTFGVEHAKAVAAHFGMPEGDAEREWNEMAGWVGEWRSVFADCGVTEADIDYLGNFLDSEEMLEHRKNATTPMAGVDFRQ